jgi:hypothetical protein
MSSLLDRLNNDYDEVVCLSGSVVQVRCHCGEWLYVEHGSVPPCTYEIPVELEPASRAMAEKAWGGPENTLLPPQTGCLGLLARA